MFDSGRGVLADWDADDEAVADAMGFAIQDALREHRRRGVSIAVWDEEAGRVVIVPPEHINIPGDRPERSMAHADRSRD